MKRKKMIYLLPLIFGFCLSSCGSSISYEEQTYTVIWQNDNGDILEMDRNVKEGTLPSYEGNTPTKEANEHYVYSFSGWDKEIKEIYENTTYTATYEKEVRTYTITWQNDTGEVLGLHFNVPYGTLPVYDGPTPTKPRNGDTYYIFSSWSPLIEKVTCDATYVATYIARKDGEPIPGRTPVLDEETGMIQYGFYPQKHIQDESLIASLNSLTRQEENGWYLYEDRYYTKEKARVYNQESYTFDDGTVIQNEEIYWFLCEPIMWRVLKKENHQYLLLSDLLLDAKSFYKDYEKRENDGNDIYANNYAYSDIRAWLNCDFYSTAFAFDDTYLIDMRVDNQSITTDDLNNVYSSEDTLDRVTLLSYQDYLQEDYGFVSTTNVTSLREAKTTDYARARGAWCNTRDTSHPELQSNGSYWTRSPSSAYSYCAWNVNSAGYLSNYAVDGNSHCVRPCITVISGE